MKYFLMKAQFFPFSLICENPRTVYGKNGENGEIGEVRTAGRHLVSKEKSFKGKNRPEQAMERNGFEKPSLS
jgi:hypothetical protein